MDSRVFIETASLGSVLEHEGNHCFYDQDGEQSDSEVGDEYDDNK